MGNASPFHGVRHFHEEGGEMTQLESEIRKHAFNNDMDLDKATFKVLVEKITTQTNKGRYDGMYEALFSEADNGLKEKG